MTHARKLHFLLTNELKYTNVDIEIYTYDNKSCKKTLLIKCKNLIGTAPERGYSGKQYEAFDEIDICRNTVLICYIPQFSLSHLIDLKKDTVSIGITLINDCLPYLAVDQSERKILGPQ